MIPVNLAPFRILLDTGRALLVNAQQLGLDINSTSADSFYLIEYILGDIC